MAFPLKNEIGNRYGKLVVVERSKNNTPWRTARWICKCDCGGSITTEGMSLRRGKCISCGCERLRGLIKYNQRGNYAKQR